MASEGGKDKDVDFDSIKHRTVEVNSINMHIAEKGEGPVVLLLHGFPDLWYCYRHQILSLSTLGYHAIAPDLRGYGDTQVPKDVNSYTIFQLVGDIVALIDLLGKDKVFLVAHDWGAIIGWYLCMFRPDRIKAYVCLSVPFRPFLGRDPQHKPLDVFRDKYGDNFYISRFEKQGEMEAELAKVDTRKLMKNILTSSSAGPAVFPPGKYWPGFNPDDPCPDPLPSWISDKDIDYYATKFTKTGFTGSLNYYRALDMDWDLTAPWTGVVVDKVPVLFITGNRGLLYTLPGVAEYIHNGDFKKDVPSLEDIKVLEGVAHFGLPQEAPEDVSNQIYLFIEKHKK